MEIDSHPTYKKISSTSYRPDIDGLRAIAVISVVIYHAFPSLIPGGYIGVDVFFVISGFLITNVIYKNLKAGSFSLLDFWCRRIRRIFPAFLTVLISIYLAGWFYLLPYEFEQIKSYIRWSLIFAINFKLKNEIGYFDIAGDSKPLLHLWSLAIEEQFYLLWPGIAWCCFRKKLNLLTITLLLSLFSFWFRHIFPTSDHHAFYLPWVRFWEILVGANIYIFKQNFHQVTFMKRYLVKTECAVHPVLFKEGTSDEAYSFSKTIASITGLFFISYSCFLFNNETPFPGKFTLLPVLGTVLIILAGRDSWINRKLLNIRPLVFIGIISYPLYLWHWPLLSFLRIIERSPSTLSVTMTVALSFILAIFTYFFIEKNLRFENSSTYQWKAISLISIQCCILIFTKYSPLKPHSVRYDLVQKITSALESSKYPVDAMTKKYLPNGFEYQEIKTKVPSYTLFIGDSHIQHLASRVEYLSNESPFDTRSSIWIASGGCLLVNGFTYEENKVCSTLPAPIFSAVFELIDNQKEFGIEEIVWGQWWWRYLDDSGFKQITRDGREVTGIEKLESRKVEILDFLQKLKKRGIKITVMLNYLHGVKVSPTSMTVRNFLGEFDIGPSMLAKSEAILLRGTGENWVANEARKLGIEVIDPLEYLCTEQECPIRTMDDRPLFKDTHHFTIYTSRELLIYIDQTINHSRAAKK